MTRGIRIERLLQDLSRQHLATGAFPVYEVRGTEVYSVKPMDAPGVWVTPYRWLGLWVYPVSEHTARASKKPWEAVEMARLVMGDWDEVVTIEMLPAATLEVIREVTRALQRPIEEMRLIRLNVDAAEGTNGEGR